MWKRLQSLRSSVGPNLVLFSIVSLLVVAGLSIHVGVFRGSLPFYAQSSNSSFSWASMSLETFSAPFRSAGSGGGGTNSSSADWERGDFSWHPGSGEVDEHERSCLARKQHILHRPASHRIPPWPELERALEKYERMHAECSVTGDGGERRNWTAEYLGTDGDGCSRVLVYRETTAGLGNKLLGLLTAFVYAMLTNRVLLVPSDRDSVVSKLLCEPFRGSTWLLPTDFPYGSLYNEPTVGSFDGSQRAINVFLEHNQNAGDQMFWCSEVREALDKVPWLVWKSNLYLVPRLVMLPELFPNIASTFPDVSLSFTRLARYLLMPANPVWEKIFRIYATYLGSARRYVGLQVRRQGSHDRGGYEAAVFNRVAHCLVNSSILPNVSVATNPALLSKMGAGSRYNRRGGAVVVDTAVLVASLQVRYYEQLQDLYSNGATQDGTLVRVHMASHEGRETQTFSQAQKAFVEMWLLSLGDQLVTSYWSTFGYIAQGLSALRPFVVNLKGRVADSPDSRPLTKSDCFFSHTLEPCQQRPFPTPFPCATNQSAPTAAHADWMHKNLRSCPDRSGGFQLVDGGPLDT